jgi:hypothetical protein
MVYDDRGAAKEERKDRAAVADAAEHFKVLGNARREWR